MPQNLNNLITFTFYSQKQITKEVNFPLLIFGGLDHIVLKKVLPNNISLIRKIGTKKTQILHQLRLRQFTPQQPIPDIQTTPGEGQPDLELIIKHDDLYPRERECEYDKPIFDSDRDNMVLPNSPEMTVRSEKTADDSTPGTTRRRSAEVIPQLDNSNDGTDTDHYMQTDADTSVEQIDPTPTNPRSSKFDLRHNPRLNCNDDYRYYIAILLWCASGTTTDTKRGFWKSATERLRSPYMFSHSTSIIISGTASNC